MSRKYTPLFPSCESDPDHNSESYCDHCSTCHDCIHESDERDSKHTSKLESKIAELAAQNEKLNRDQDEFISHIQALASTGTTHGAKEFIASIQAEAINHARMLILEKFDSDANHHSEWYSGLFSAMNICTDQAQSLIDSAKGGEG